MNAPIILSSKMILYPVPASFLIMYGTIGFEVKFSIALTTDVVANFKKSKPSAIQAGSTLVVHVGGLHSSCYIRNGDQVELRGRIIKNTLSNGVVCHYIATDHLYNVSLRFSFDY